jgi:hypothetical protein
MRALTAISVILAVAASVGWLIIPAYTIEGTHGTTHATLIEVNGGGAVAALAFPVLVALTPLLVPRRSLRIGAAAVLGAFTFVSGFSIGLFYFPSAVAMLVAAVLSVASDDAR